jgi:transitional endoplasmic reticulum ATPase
VLAAAAAWWCWWHTDAMTPWRVRDFHADDLDAVVRLWDNPAASSEAPAFSLSDLIAAVRSHEPAVVAVAGEELVGAAVATVSGDRAWVMRISLAGAWRQRGIGSAMLGELERRLVAAGVHRIHCLLGGGSEIGALALEHAGYTARQGMVFYERLEPVDPGSAGVLGQLGGRMIRAGAWEQLGGMVKEKELIDRRVILPLAQPQLAERLGLVPPRAIVLFGPPGTGKTTFAKGAASRLGWPFVELFPSRLAGESPAGLAAALREAFSLVAELDKVVLFIDEVEEIAGARQPRTVSATQGVTNEILKLIPPFREQDERLLICATNSVRALDSAFLRHGRFDYVIPVGVYAGCPFTVTCAPVASVTRAAPNSWPAVHAPGLTPARTRWVVSAAMAAVARTPSPTRSSAVTVCPSGPVTSAQLQESVPLLCAAGLAMYATTLAAPLASLAVSRSPTGAGSICRWAPPKVKTVAPLPNASRTT